MDAESKHGGEAGGIAQPRMSAVGVAGILAFVALVSVVDYAGGYEMDVFVFYFLPVAVAAWGGNRFLAYVIAVLCAAAWLTADRMSGHIYVNATNLWWNAGVRLLSFLIIGHDVARIRAGYEIERQAKRKAVSELRAMQGLLPICASCKKIRDDQGYWRQLEHFIESHSEARFTHGLCKACADKMIREYESLSPPAGDSQPRGSRPA